MNPSPSHFPKLRIHSLVPWDRGAKARWLLTELGVDFETRLLDRQKGEHETPEFLKLNPMGRVPVLETGSQAMFESGAICAYLGDLFADRGIAPLLNSPDRPLYQQWLYFAASTLDVFQTRIMIIEDFPAGELYEKKLAALQSDVRDALGALDQALAKSDFLVGNRFTVADICVSYHLFWSKLWPELDGVQKDFPRVNAYLERMKAMPSAIQAKVFSYEG